MILNFLPVDTESSIPGDDDMMNYFLIDLKSTKYRLMYGKIENHNSAYQPKFM
jgi:hypothetical protein